VTQGKRETKVTRVTPEQLALKARQALKVFKGFKARQEPQGRKGRRAKQVLKGHKVFRGKLARKDLKASKVKPVPQELPDLLDQQES